MEFYSSSLDHTLFSDTVWVSFSENTNIDDSFCVLNELVVEILERTISYSIYTTCSLGSMYVCVVVVGLRTWNWTVIGGDMLIKVPSCRSWFCPLDTAN